MAFFINVFRADFEACEQYTVPDGPMLDIPLLVLGGASDPRVSAQDLEKWRDLTTSIFKLALFPGGHFYYRPRLKEILSEMVRFVDAATDICA